MADVRNDNGMYYGWESGQAGFGANVNQNFLDIGMFSNIGVISMALPTPPVSPSAGDAYIVADSGTGDWNGEDGNLAVWTYEIAATTRSWVILEPKMGWLAFDFANSTLHAHNGTQWSDGGPLFVFTP
ncbi:MAG: DUF2793 domain-containing protein [Candidatus Humimicrobiaceae bacterium]